MNQPARLLTGIGLLAAARLVDAASGVSATIDLADGVSAQIRLLARLRKPDVAAEVREVGRVLERCSAWVPGARCLHRAAAGRVWLAVRGVDSEIVVGVRRDERWQAHAWLEADDDGARIVLFAEEVSFQPIWRRE